MFFGFKRWIRRFYMFLIILNPNLNKKGKNCAFVDWLWSDTADRGLFFPLDTQKLRFTTVPTKQATDATETERIYSRNRLTKFYIKPCQLYRNTINDQKPISLNRQRPTWKLRTTFPHDEPNLISFPFTDNTLFPPITSLLCTRSPSPPRPYPPGPAVSPLNKNSAQYCDNHHSTVLNM